MDDKYLEEILYGLERVDEGEFERCVLDLLQDDYPKLVPIPGGSDRGFDGALPDDDGNVMPLIVTTASRFADVKRNLIQSIASARASGELVRPEAVFATSFELTGHYYFALRRAARQNGVKLLQAYGRSAIAQRLYRRSDLCRRLLGFSRGPSALSVVPRTQSSFPGLEPIGREADLQWLRETQGDRLLYGQPGSGKTFLLAQLAAEGRGVFASSADVRDLASAIRDVQPRVIFVDDAHVRLEALENLVHLRRAIGVEFSLLVTAWPGERDVVAHALGGVPRCRMRKLELLTRDQVVELYRRLGVDVPNDVMRELVDQAANKPGLAAAIARAWLAGDRYEALSGDALRASVVARLGWGRRGEATEILASLAIGGDAGVSLESVARFIGAELRDIRHETARLHDGGVLHEVERGVLSVLPRPLRASLLKEVFFSPERASLHPLDHRRLLEDVPSLYAATSAIIDAVHRGARLPREELCQLVLRAQQENPWRAAELWRRFAAIGEPEATWVLEKYPGDLCDVAAATLRHAADATIRRLLAEARTAEGPLHNQPRHPLRILSDWLRDLDAGVEGSLRRRETCVELARRFVGSEDDRRVAINAICLAMEPGLEGRSRDPGLGNRIELRWALLPPHALRRLATCWAELRPLITPLDVATWRGVSTMLAHWIHPEWVAHGPVEDAQSRAELKAVVETAMRDLMPLADHRPGLADAIRELAVAAGIDVDAATDETFETLFPRRERASEPQRAGASRRTARIRELAASWSRREPKNAVADLDLYLTEARFLGPGREDLTRALCQELARLVESPVPWLDALATRPRPSPLLAEPFLARCIRERIEHWRSWLEYCLDDKSLSVIALEQLLCLEDGIPDDLVERALNGARRFAPIVETLASQRLIPLETTRRLLRDDDRIVAVAAAIGEWESDVNHQVRPELRDDWQCAILRITRDDLASLGAVATLEGLLGEVLRGDAALASKWLRRLVGEGFSCVEIDGPVSDALDSLSPKQRSEILGLLGPASASEELIRRLVARDQGVYRRLLNDDRLADHHASPLAGMPDREWESMALVALAEGRSPAWVADAALDEMRVYFESGEGDLWDRWCVAFHALEESESDALRQVGAAGRMIIERRKTRAIERHRERQISGY